MVEPVDEKCRHRVIVREDAAPLSWWECVDCMEKFVPSHALFKLQAETIAVMAKAAAEPDEE